MTIYENLDLHGLILLLAKGTAGDSEWNRKITQLEQSWQKLGLKEVRR
jgi:hypothetical protein